MLDCSRNGVLKETILPEFALTVRHGFWCSQVTPGALGMDYVGR